MKNRFQKVKRWLSELAVVVFLLLAYRHMSIEYDIYQAPNTYKSSFHKFIGIAEQYKRTVPDTLLLNLERTQEHLGKYYMWWGTPVKNMEVDSVLQHFRNGEFQPWRRNPFAQPANNLNYWFYLNIKNPFPKDVDLFFGLGHGGYTVTLYKLNNNGTYQKIDSTSVHAPISKRPYPTSNLRIPITVPANELHTYLFKIQKTSVRSLLVTFALARFDDPSLYPQSFVNLESVVFGLFPFAIVLQLMLFLIFRDRLYIYQALYIFSMGIMAINNYNMLTVLLPEGLYIPLSYMPLLLPATASAIFMCIIFRRFTKFNVLLPKLDKGLTFIMWLNLASVAIHLILYLLYFQLSEDIFWGIADIARWVPIASLVVFIPFMMICSVITYIYTKEVTLKLYTGALFFALLLWGFHLTNLSGVTNRSFYQQNNLQSALVVEICIFTALMLIRFYNERRERITLLENQLLIKETHTLAVIEAQESERKRIAQELHDGLGGYLVAMRLMVNKKKNSLTEASLPDALTTLTEMQNKLDTVIKDVRDISHNLMPNEFDSKDFSDILKEHISYFNENGDVEIQYFFDGKVNMLAKEIQINLYRIIAELIKNIEMHAKATQATIQLIAHDQTVVLQVEDNGIGFEPQYNMKSGLGLKNIRSRVVFMSGNMNIDSSKIGSTLTIEIPVVYRPSH